jgi:methionyl-tRNA synthetase
MEAVGCILNYALTIVGNIAIACEPFLPDASISIRRQLNSSAIETDWNAFWKKEVLIEPVPQHHQLNKAELVFRNVEDDDIERQIEKLKKTKPQPAEVATTSHPVKPVKADIVFDDFSKMDIRVATVMAAEKMAKSDKLLKLTVDIGLEQRTIVSGIARHYSPEEMIGKQVTVVANLAPRKMMGVESQGMILMAEDRDGKLRLLSPSDLVNPGSAVS